MITKAEKLAWLEANSICVEIHDAIRQDIEDAEMYRNSNPVPMPCSCAAREWNYDLSQAPRDGTTSLYLYEC